MEQLEHPQITHILRMGYPTQQNYPERDDVEVIELSDEKYTEIITSRRQAEKGLHK